MTDSAMPRRTANFAPPTRGRALLFLAKMLAFRFERLVWDMAAGPRRLPRDQAQGAVVALSRTALWGDPAAAERAMQWGKVQNLRVAARLLDGTRIDAGQIFSFWKQLGRPSRARGFVDGRMLREGCLVASAGGGLCQLSNALYDVALQVGCEIIERHAHSRLMPGSAAARGRDATVAWNYVDLRFRAPRVLVLGVTLTRAALEVRLNGANDQAFTPAPVASSTPDAVGAARSCGTCDETNCFRHEGERRAPTGHTAFLVDENWSEFRRHVAQAKKDGDVLGLPAPWVRGWEAFGHTGSAPVATLMRGLTQRFAAPGAGRRAAELRGSMRTAQSLSQLLTPDMTDIVVAQSLLPTLWRNGILGGRGFSVLMTRMPMAEIQRRLDDAARRHPERKTLSDFRADPALVLAESEALSAADAIIAPHAEIAALFQSRAIPLEWDMPKPAKRGSRMVRNRIAFPGPTLARKGAYELRAAARALDLEIVLTGSELEGADFWQDVRTIRADATNWLDGVACVVQPALLEDAPRRLLQALASGVPVIATSACGLPQQPALTIIKAGDVEGLIAAIETILSRTGIA